MGSGEKKIIIVLLYYALLIVIALTAFTLAMRNVDFFRDELGRHFACEARGFNPDSPCDRERFESTRHPVASLLAYILLLLFPVINFTFVINFRETRKWVCQHLLKREESFSNDRGAVFSSIARSASHSTKTNDNVVTEGVGEKPTWNKSDMFSKFSVDLPVMDASPYLSSLERKRGVASGNGGTSSRVGNGDMARNGGVASNGSASAGVADVFMQTTV